MHGKAAVQVTAFVVLPESLVTSCEFWGKVFSFFVDTTSLNFLRDTNKNSQFPNLTLCVFAVILTLEMLREFVACFNSLVAEQPSHNTTNSL